MNKNVPKENFWIRKDLKKNARYSVKKNYWKVAVVSLLTFFFVQGFYTFSTGSVTGAVHLPQQAITNSEIVNTFIGNSDNAFSKFMSPYLEGKTGVMATLFDNFTDSGSFIFGLLNAGNQAIFNDRIGFMFIILIGLLIMMLYKIFVKNIIKVGSARFFLENSYYEGTNVSRMAYIFQIGKIRNTALTMFMLNLFQGLWNLTIIGGIIKRYSYRMVPFLVAENPEIGYKEAILLSRNMMYGNKWKTFLLDLSFILWYILGLLTLGIFDYFYVYPYRTQTDAFLYQALRAPAKKAIPEASKWLMDEYLYPAEGYVLTDYPVASYLYPTHEKRKWTTLDYTKRYSIWSLILMFLTFCVAGWLWEVTLNIFINGEFVNRGVLHGPWLPIYGSGGIMIIVVLRKFRSKPMLFFGLSMLLCGVLEYAVAWWLETFKGATWWNYDDMLFNIQGRICLEGLLFFGLGGLLFTYVLAPILDRQFCRIPKKVLYPLCIAMIVLFATDFLYSQVHPNMAAASEKTSLEYSSTYVAEVYKVDIEN